MVWSCGKEGGWYLGECETWQYGDELRDRRGLKCISAAFMDLEKAYDRVDWRALWDVFKIYGVGGKLHIAIKSSYEKASTCVKSSGETSEHFEIKVGLRQGCVMSPWLFNIYMDGVMREMNGKVGEVLEEEYQELPPPISLFSGK